MKKPASAFTVIVVLVCLIACTRETREQETLSQTGGPVIIISIDTLRADRLPAWGYDGIETPAIDSLVRDGVRFSSAWSHVPLTLPSHASIFTGLLPGQHGVRDNLGYRLGTQYPTLGELLVTKGYVTAGMVSAWVLREDSGIARGFQSWDDGLEARPGVAVGELQRSGVATADAALRWLDGRGDEPWFLFVHLFEPHAPYAPPEPFRSRHSDPYDGEIAAADAIVGRLLSSLRASGKYDEATIILLSDHGEGLGDHGEAEHGIFLYREAIHVPLVVKLPASQMSGTTVTSAVQLIDVFPTVLQVADITRDSSGSRAISLIDTLVEAPRTDTRRAFSESMYPRIHFGWSELTSLTDGSAHVIDAPRPELYRMEADPAEVRNIVEAERRLYADFRNEIQSTRTPYSAPAPVNAEDAAKLAALGYLGAGPSGSSGPLPDPKDRIHELESMTAAWAALREGRPDEAIRLYESLLKTSPRIADAWMQLSSAYETVGRLEDAVRASRRAIEIAPSLGPGVALTIARLQLRMGDLEGAASHADLASSVSPEEAAVIRGRVALAREDFAGAESIVAPLLSSERFRGQATVIVAQAHVGRRDPQRAIRILEQERSRLLAAGLPFPSQMEFARGDALVRVGRVDEAIEAFRSEIARHPTDMEAYARLAVIHVLAGRVDQAETVMQQLVEANPGPSGYELAADTFERLRRPDLADTWRARRP